MATESNDTVIPTQGKVYRIDKFKVPKSAHDEFIQKVYNASIP